jgi:hypothetical protein
VGNATLRFATKVLKIATARERLVAKSTFAKILTIVEHADSVALLLQTPNVDVVTSVPFGDAIPAIGIATK